MQWIPVVTFLQVSADMAVAVDVPDGHGHVYVKDVANAWAAVLQPPGWTPEKTERLRPLLSNDENAYDFAPHVRWTRTPSAFSA